MAEEKKTKKRKSSKSKSASKLEKEAEPTNTVVLADKATGKEKSFPIDNCLARDVEEYFQLVKTHLESTQHTAHFPNKTTGLYMKLDTRAKYYVYGHPYSPEDIWRPRVQTQTAAEFEIEDLEVYLLNAKLKKMKKPFLGIGKAKWPEQVVKAKYCQLDIFEADGKKPETFDLKGAQVSIRPDKEHPFAFEVFNSDGESHVFEPSNKAGREEWMSLINNLILYDPEVAEKRKHNKEKAASEALVDVDLDSDAESDK